MPRGLKMPLPADVVGAMTGSWEVELMNAPCANPLKFCYGFFCPCCFAIQQREKILEITGERYVCCGGLWPCCCFGEPCDSSQPYLCMEACCCPHWAIIGNRFMTQTRFNVQNDPCDDTLLAVIGCLQCLACIIECCGTPEQAQCAGDAIECVNASVCSCMLVQQDIQLKKILDNASSNPYHGMPQYILHVLPPKQQQMYQTMAPAAPPAPPAPGPGPYAGAPAAGPYAGGAPAAAPPMGQPLMQPVVQAAPARQMMITVPPGVAPGQMVAYTTPEGAQMTATVPPGYSEGQQFLVSY